MDNLLFKIEIQGVTEQVKELGRLKTVMADLKKEEKDLNQALKDKKITTDSYNQSLGTLTLKMDACRKETSELKSATAATATAFAGAEGSMVRLNQELGNARERYRAMSQAERENAEIGGKLLTSIQAQDAQIKKLDASIGNHQRNVGNYPGLMGMMGSSLASNIPILGTMSGALAGITSQTAAATGATGGISKGMMFAGGAILAATAAFGMLYSAMSDGIKLSIKSEERMSMLAFALNGNARAAEEMAGYAGKLANTSLFKKGDIIDAENYALSLGRTEAQTRKLIEAAMGLSRATGVDLHTATAQMSATYEGQIGRMGKIEGSLKNLTKEELASGVAVDILYNKFARYGHEGLETAGGQLAIAEKKMSLFHKNMAEFWMPIVVKATEKWADFWGWVTGAKAPKSGSFMQDFAKQQADALTAANKSGQDAIVKVNEDRAASFYKLWKAATDPNMRAQYAKNYDEQLEINKNLKKQQEELNSKGDFSDPDAAKKAAEAAEKARKEFEDNLKKRTDVIKSNNDYILDLGRKLIDDQIMAMADGRVKEEKQAQDKYEDEVIAINKERRDRIQAINETIKDTKAKGEQLKQLEDQKVQIAAGANKRIEGAQEAHQGAMAAIEKKYNKSTEDTAITTKYSQDVAKTEQEGQIKLEVLREYYKQKGTLTVEESKKQAADEIKINLDVAQKKYDLLYAEIEARKALGTITKEEYDKQLKQIAKLYGDVKKLTGQGDDIKAKPKDKIVSFVAEMFNITDEQAGKVLNAVEQLANKIQKLFLDAQANKIKAELKSETAKVDAQFKSELKALDEKRKHGLITEAQYNAAKEKLDEKAAKKKDELNKEAFEKNKKLQIITASIAGAVAVIQMLANPGGIAGIILAALTAIAVAAEIITISNQKYEGAKGGLLSGPSHAQGGIKYAMGGNILELEGDEAVTNKRTLADPTRLIATGTAYEITSALNSRNGYGVPLPGMSPSGTPIRSRSGIGSFRAFESGGYMPVATPSRQTSIGLSGQGSASMAEMIATALNTQRIIVVESDITETQKQVKKTEVKQQW